MRDFLHYGYQVLYCSDIIQTFMSKGSGIFLVQVQLRTEVLHTPSSILLEFKLITSIFYHERTFHVIEMPALTTRPSVTKIAQT